MKRPETDNQLIQALLDAYRQGAFPMADPDTGAVAFYTAPMRGVFPIAPGDPLGSFHIPRSLRRRLNSDWFDIRCGTAFVDVVRSCAEPRPDDPETWINDDILNWLTALHEIGVAHSVEAWRRDPTTGAEHLVGGVYGLTLGGAFCGESMFSRPRQRLAAGQRHPLDGADASKVCLVHLVNHLKNRGYTLFDTQLINSHIAQFGCVEITHDQYMSRLEAATKLPVTWGQFA